MTVALDWYCACQLYYICINMSCWKSDLLVIVSWRPLVFVHAQSSWTKKMVRSSLLISVESLRVAVCLQLLYWTLVLRLIASQELNGPQVCQERIIVNSSRTVPTTYFDYADCDGQLPPCVKTKFQTKYFLEEKDVRYCCQGWMRTGNNCSQPCPANTYGRNCNDTCNCTEDENTYCHHVVGCSCRPGLKPPNCSIPCDLGSYGSNCSQFCTCLNGATCDRVNGSCTCTPGWMGADCNTTCPANCSEGCSCDVGFTCDNITGNCTQLETSSSEATNDPTEGARLAGIIAGVIGGTMIIVVIVGAILCNISKRFGDFLGTVSRTASIGIFAEPEKRTYLSSQQSEEQCEQAVIQPSPPVPNPSLEEGESDANEPLLGNAVNEVAGLATVTVHAEGTEAAASEAATAEAEPVADGLPRAGTVRRNKRDELPPTLPRPKCSWAEDENAYSELGGGPEQNQTLASKPKPNVKPRSFTRKPSSTETAGNEASNKRADPVYHVLNPDQSGED